MSIGIFQFLSLMLLSLNCTQPSSKNFNAPMRNAASIMLQEIKPKECVYDLFTAVIKSNQKLYQPQTHFFSVDCQRNSKIIFLTIKPDFRNQSAYNDYARVTKVGSYFFLFRGTAATDTNVGLTVKKKLSIDIRPSKDSTYTLSYSQDPVLHGRLPGCGENDMYVEVYTEHKIIGYYNR